PACPEELPLVDMLLELRSGGAFPQVPGQRGAGAKNLLVAGPALHADPERCARTLALLEGYDLAEDDGSDIVGALEAGTRISGERMASFLAPLRAARRLVVGDGLLLRALRRWLPQVSICGIGEALLPAVGAKLRAGDFYVIA